MSRSFTRRELRLNPYEAGLLEVLRDFDKGSEEPFDRFADVVGRAVDDGKVRPDRVRDAVEGVGSRYAATVGPSRPAARLAGAGVTRRLREDPVALAEHLEALTDHTRSPYTQLEKGFWLTEALPTVAREDAHPVVGFKDYDGAHVVSVGRAE